MPFHDKKGELRYLISYIFSSLFLSDLKFSYFHLDQREMKEALEES